jgi:hypothetical protein
MSLVYWFSAARRHDFEKLDEIKQCATLYNRYGAPELLIEYGTLPRQRAINATSMSAKRRRFLPGGYSLSTTASILLLPEYHDIKL